MANNFRHFLIICLATVFYFFPMNASAEGTCYPTYICDCKCPPGCDQTLCQGFSGLRAQINGHCIYGKCVACSCGAYGHRASPDALHCIISSVFNLLTPSQAWAAEGEVEFPKRVQTPLGEFFITKPPADSASDQSGSVGILIEVKEDYLHIGAVSPNGPAEKAGLVKGQRILSIDGKSTKGMGLESASQALRGRPGTLVVLRIKQGKIPWGKKVPLIRSSSSFHSILPKQDDDVRFESVSLEKTGGKSCPPTHMGCYFLFLDDDKKNCTYACRTDSSAQ